jgi:beta-lactam-binding protein with PASTA domain
MPWLAGMPQAEAERLISSGGLKIAKTTSAPSPQWPKGTVIEQAPSQGSKVTGDTAIEIVVAE